ncbi:L,D-transpeptidase family protein [Bosea sp. TAF32]|uniref:L,D-transpeptidase family protein n=1 Tax=Bosea sp. TAF32 TaxID=3237482 RepID=UPI003F8DA915
MMTFVPRAVFELLRKCQAALLCGCVLLAPVAAHALTADEVNRAGPPTTTKSKVPRPNASIVKAQVLLARQGISPGEIDGLDGDNYRKAIYQFRRRQNLGAGDIIDTATWQVLKGDVSSDIVSDYVVTKEDIKTRYVRRIPHDYARQARMKRLGYRSAQEMFAERFHMSEGLLRTFNPRSHYGKREETLHVVSVGRTAPSDEARTVEADKTNSIVRALDATGKVIAIYPATIGSEDTPSPEGEYQVVRIVKNPTYHYDPVKNFQQGKNKRRLVLPRGPNNPVGSVWIELSKPTFGIHGTPEPSKISKASWHGCVRLTNWDAEELAQIVRPGTTVRFIE